MRIHAVFLWLACASVAAANPAAAVAAAHADCARLPEDAQKRTRYFSLYAIPEKGRAEYAKVMNVHINSLSREAHPQPCRVVAKDLLAVDIRDYTWDAKVWERLATEDPYFHALIEITKTVETTIQKHYPAGTYDGKYYEAGDWPVVVRTKTKVKKTSAAPWLPPKETAALALMTQSEIPIVRADWFLFQTAIQADRKAGYYDFLGLGKSQKDFEELLGGDEVKSKKAKREIIGLMARSGVTLNNRVITRLGAASGGWWKTYDFKKSFDRSNVLRQLDADLEPPEGDASEQYGHLPNDLFTFWLQNGQGVRQDFAPDFIASNKSSPHATSDNDGRVHIGLSCIACHVAGLQPVKDYARRLYKGSIQLASPDHAKLVRLRQLYLSDLDGAIRDDNAKYVRALHKISGMKPAEFAKAYAAAWYDYAEKDLDADRFARELGTTKAHLVKALKARAKSITGLDPVLALLIADEPLDIRREHADEAFALAQIIIREIKP